MAILPCRYNIIHKFIKTKKKKKNPLRKRTLSPVRLALEDSSIRSFVLFVDVSLFVVLRG